MGKKHKVTDPFVKKVIASINRNPQPFNVQDIADEVQCALEEEGDFYSGEYFCSY